MSHLLQESAIVGTIITFLISVVSAETNQTFQERQPIRSRQPLNKRDIFAVHFRDRETVFLTTQC